MIPYLKTIAIAVLLFTATLPAVAQVDIRVLQQGTYVSLDTVKLIIDANDASGTGAGSKVVFFNIYNLSPAHTEAFYVEAEWLCSNSSAHYQFCQEYPPDYNSGTCHTYHRDGKRTYADYDYQIPPDTCTYNYLKCYLKIYNYSIEKEHEKICRFKVIRRNTNEVLDVMYLVIRRGNLPCGATGISAAPADEIAEIYPNPAHNLFSITAKQDQLTGCTLYAPDGKMIWDRNIGQQARTDLSVSDLPNGIYYLKLRGRKGEIFYRKIAVRH